MPRILTVIVSYNGMKWLERCIGSVQRSSVSSDILIVDNCSTDGSAEYLETLQSESFQLIRSEENLGFARANNIGLRLAIEKGYDYVYLLNQDAWVAPDAFEKIVGAFESKQGRKFGILSPMQMKDGFTEPDEQFRKQCWKDLEQSDTDIVPVRFVMAAHWMISMKCLKAAGVFSPSFRHYGEDDNLIDRARFHGFSTGIVRSAMAVHDRDSRPRPKAYRMMLKTVHANVMVSDPGRPLVLTLIWAPMWIVGMGLYHMSLQMIPEAFRLVGRYPELVRNRTKSKKQSAFVSL